MKTLNNIRQEWKELEDYDKDFFRYFVIFFIPIASIIIWLCSTTTPPVLDIPVENTQLQKQTYELKGSWVKYAEGVYDRKFNQ